TGALLRTFEGGRSVAFSPDGSRVLSASVYGMKLWDAATDTLLRTFERSSDGPVAFSPDGTRVLSGIRLWDAGSGALLRTFEGHSEGPHNAQEGLPGREQMKNRYGQLGALVYDLDKPIGCSFGDIEFYKERLAGCRGPILEPAVGNGRMLIPLLENDLNV